MRSARRAARGKRTKPDVAAFLLEMEPQCFALGAQLAAGDWRPGQYTSFYIAEPKARLISAAPFCDRVVHHAMVALLEPHFERRFVAHSYACRVNKGTHRALLRAATLSRKCKYVLKGDVVKFFPSIDHDIIKAQVARVISDERLLRVLAQIIDGSNPQEPVQEWYDGDDLFCGALRRRGLPIGNLTSQFLANVLLDKLDHAVMDDLGFGDYVRYCDDFLVFGDSRQQLWQARANIERVLGGLRLRLHPRKGGVHCTGSTIPFLGFTLRNGRRRLQHDGVVRATRRLRKAGQEVAAGHMSADQLRTRVAAWMGHAMHASNLAVVDTVLARAGVGRAAGNASNFFSGVSQIA